jgi:N-acetylated-alpha-linked acidic dipeptidase
MWLETQSPTHTLTPQNRHILFAPSSVNSYGSSLFPGVSDTLFNAVNFGGSWDNVRRQLDFVRNHLRFAAGIMSEPSLDYPPMN